MYKLKICSLQNTLQAIVDYLNPSFLLYVYLAITAHSNVVVACVRVIEGEG